MIFDNSKLAQLEQKVAELEIKIENLEADIDFVKKVSFNAHNKASKIESIVERRMPGNEQ